MYLIASKSSNKQKGPAPSKPAAPAGRKQGRSGKAKKQAQPTLSSSMAAAMQTVRTENIADERAMREYCEHLVAIDKTRPAGIPSQEIGIQDTGLIDTIQSFDVSVNLTGTGPNYGRFGMVFRPDLGDASDPHLFKVAMVNNTDALGDADGWPLDLTAKQDPNAFVRNVGRSSLTVDPQSRSLIQPPPTYYEAYGTTGTGGASVHNGGPLGGPTAAQGTPGAFVVNNTTDDLLNPQFGASPIVTDLNTIAAASPVNSITLPPGQFLLSFSTQFLNGATSEPNGAISNHLLAPSPTSAANAAVSQQDGGAAQADATEVSSEWVVSVYGTAATFLLRWDTQPTVDWATDVTLTASWARPDTLNNPAPGYPLSGGPVRTYVPVAMNVLATFVAPSLTVEGEIAIGPLAPDVCAINVFTNQPRAQAGNPLYVENLRTYPDAYDGKLSKGVYGVWSPYSKEDMFMRSPEDNRAHDWPCIALAGKVNPGMASPSATFVVLRVFVWSTYQFTSDTRVFDLRKRYGSALAQERALRQILTFNRFGENGKHIEEIKRFLARVASGVKSVYDWGQNNKSWLIPAGQALMSLI